jgi:predicted Fe-S protein YdhL (DUF1289 family)
MIESPCNRHCGLNTDNICVGCGRTVRELRIWNNCNDEEKQEIVSQSRDRLRSMQSVRDEGISEDNKT